MAIDTGLRSKEIFSLTKSMIDLDARTINLPASLTKAWKARTIPISARLEAELTAHFARHDLKKQDLVFLGQKDCKKAFKSLTEYCGIADLTFHDLRHTATTWMDEAGVSNAAKMNIVGHSSERTHQRYHNLSENVIDAVREKIDEFHLKRSGVSNG
jgi:integrase